MSPMNKIVTTSERIFMCVTGASGTGKTQLILSMLTVAPAVDNDPSEEQQLYTTFQPHFDKHHVFLPTLAACLRHFY